MERNIVHKWYYDHSPEVVWKYLTDPELLKEWLMENNFRPELGYKFRFRTRSKINLGFDGNIYCEVLEIVPARKLSYTWVGGPGNGKITLDSVVTWTLTPKGSGTELLLEHKGFKGFKNFISYLIMNKGWVIILRKKLQSRLTSQFV
jgi:uncharacterized protein YndB with AHSA1/START domain